MTGMMLYLSLGLMVLTVISNRYWRRQLRTLRVSQGRIKDSVDEVTKDVADVATAYAQLSHQVSEAEKRVAKAEQEMQHALLELDQKREAPVTRYYVFDRVEPRPGRFWEVAVRFAPLGTATLNGLPADRHGQRSWVGVRRFILVADTERDVRDRVTARYPRKLGYELVEVASCRLSGLSVNRIPELSTFRRPGGGEDESRQPRRAAGGQR